MRIFAAVTLASLIGICSFIYYVDPAGRWHRYPLTLEANWSKTEVLVTPKDFDEMTFRCRHLELIETPDLVLFGSSRILSAGAEMFAPGLKVFNTAVSGASIEDHVTLWQHMKALGKVPCFALVSIDPWVFNDAADPIRWMRKFDRYAEFRRSMQLGALERTQLEVKLIWLRAQSFSIEFSEILNRPMLRSALKNFLLGDNPMAMEVVPRALKGPESRAFGADGGYYYPASLEEGRTRAEISELVSERIMAKDVYGLANWDFSSFRFGLLVDFVQDLQKNGTQVMLLGPPYHPDAYRLLQQRRDVSELLGVYERALVDVGFRTGASVCSSLDPSLVVCGEEDFIDEMHMRRTCYSKFLSHCLQTDRAWEHLDRRP